MGRRCGNVHSRASLVGARARELERPPRRSFVSSCDLRITWSAARGAQVPRPAPGEKRRASPAPAPELAGGPPGPGPDLGGGVPRAAWSGVLGAGSGPCECAWARPGGASDLLLGPSAFHLPSSTSVTEISSAPLTSV
ncbi:interferon epsilon isoform X3 [Trachypithecus francoisi]|uniref:interferon epsilon isoform X3 n=1 Tax=Trachypithecus francoisi TaxID=54180 RepID=UPI00141A82E5|nr:interferon epsilon isoform X3 [Trachypithecus francoisi]